MGKIILTERQYRNLNQILIGKEIENNKGRLNEAAMTPDEQIIAESIGKKIKYYLKDCAEPQGRESGNWCINKMLGLLKQLKTHEQFDEATKFTGYQYTDIGYGVDRSWTQNLGSFLTPSTSLQSSSLKKNVALHHTLLQTVFIVSIKYI